MKVVSAQLVSCCICEKAKINSAAHARQRSNHVALLGRSGCSSPSTKDPHELLVTHTGERDSQQEVKARIGPIVKQIWLLDLHAQSTFFGISLTQLLTTRADTFY